MYYCLHCRKLHDVTKEPEEMVFSTGFVYLDEMKYHAGLCRQAESDSEESSAECG